MGINGAANFTLKSYSSDKSTPTAKATIMGVSLKSPPLSNATFKPLESYLSAYDVTTMISLGYFT